MLARNVATSARVATIPWFIEALWLRGIPFCDDAGMMDADPEEIKTMLVPRGKNGKQIPISQIEKALETLETVQLITVHACDFQTCIRYVNFEKFQTLKANRGLQIDCKNPDGIACLDVESIGIHWNPLESKYFPNAREESNGNPVRARGSGSGSEDEEESGDAHTREPEPEKAARLRGLLYNVGKPIPPEMIAEAQDEALRDRRRR
jgi:hypothetical protein